MLQLQSNKDVTLAMLKGLYIDRRGDKIDNQDISAVMCTDSCAVLT